MLPLYPLGREPHLSDALEEALKLQLGGEAHSSIRVQEGQPAYEEQKPGPR
jgi:hypothetical protein